MYLIYLFMYCAFLRDVFAHRIEVKLKQGKIKGTRLDTVFDGRLYYAFFGVPYAEAPIGPLRFKDPEPVKSSQKPFNAGGGHRVTCAQAHIAYKKKYGVENCLHLNVYTTDLKQPKPVVVWFHGYGFISSFSHIFSGDFFLEQDVVFVSVTYRIGVFGFLKVNNTATDANMGLKDMVRSLKWIRKNIEHFGGDNKKVTVMGNGSAASCLSLLLLTKARKLFTKMIIHSGSMFSPSLFQGDIDRERTKVISEIEKKMFSKMKTAAASDIIASSLKIYSATDIMNSQRSLVPFIPIQEEKSKISVLNVKPNEYIKKHERLKTTIPILIGFNTQESISEAIPFISNPYYLLHFKPFFKFLVPFSDGCRYPYNSTTYGKIANEITNFYFKDGVSENSVHEFVKYSSDLQKYPIYKFIKNLVDGENKVFVFKFNYRGNFNAMKSNSVTSPKIKLRGTASGDELCYLMKCEPYLEAYIKGNITRDREFIRDISKMWSNFVKFGDPTPTGYTGKAWPPMTSKNDNILLIDGKNEIINTNVEEKMYKFWNDLYEKYYAEDNCKKITKDEL